METHWLRLSPLLELVWVTLPSCPQDVVSTTPSSDRAGCQPVSALPTGSASSLLWVLLNFHSQVLPAALSLKAVPVYPILRQQP